MLCAPRGSQGPEMRTLPSSRRGGGGSRELGGPILAHGRPCSPFLRLCDSCARPAGAGPTLPQWCLAGPLASSGCDSGSVTSLP